MAAARFRVRLPCGGFKTRVLRFKVKNTPLKTKNGKRKFKRMLSFLFVEEGKLFIKKSSFEEFNFVFFLRRSAWPVLKGFAEVSGTFCSLWPRKLRFWEKENLCFYKCFMDVLYFFPSVLKKNFKTRLDLKWILCWIWIFLAWTDPRSGSVARIALKD